MLAVGRVQVVTACRKTEVIACKTLVMMCRIRQTEVTALNSMGESSGNVQARGLKALLSLVRL